MLVTRFILGLKDEIRPAVEIQLPTTVAMAATYALVQEGVLDRMHQTMTKVTPPKLYTQS